MSNQDQRSGSEGRGAEDAPSEPSEHSDVGSSARGSRWRWGLAGIGVLVVVAAVVVWLVVRGDGRATSDDPVPRGDAVLTTFQWTWNSVAKECTETIGPAGFGYVQISPPQETIRGEQWWTSYQPVSYDLESKLGTSEEFQRMVDTCADAGVGIIVDAVINHMAAVDQAPGIGVAGTEFDEDYFAGLYTAEDFNECRTNIRNYQNREDVQNCRLLGLQDLATGQDSVQDTIARYLDGFIDMGVQGFRIDAAKHIPAEDLAQIKAKLSDPDVLWIQEVIRGAGEPIQPEEYVATGKVNEFAYGRLLVDDFNNQIKMLQHIGKGLLPSADAVVFVDNHDTERNGSTLTYKDDNAYLLANIFMLGWDYGQPAVYTGYAFEDNDEGAPGADEVSVPDVDCATEQWTCLHQWDEIRAMVQFHNQTAGTAVSNWWDNGRNVVAFGRSGEPATGGPTAPISGPSETTITTPPNIDDRNVEDLAEAGSGLGFLAINNEDSMYRAGVGDGNEYQDAQPGSAIPTGSLIGPKFKSSLPQGNYCNVLVANCEEVIEVAADGSFAAEIPAGSALVLHVGAQQ